MEPKESDTISSSEVERQTGINAAQFRKDLSYFGEFGKSGVGYRISDLTTRISHILHIDVEQSVVLVGAGNLGSALAGYPGLKEHRFQLTAVFDNNDAKIGTEVLGLTVKSMPELASFCWKSGVQIAILAVPSSSAQHVAETLLDAGIRAILNFAPVSLKVPEGIVVRNVSFLTELAVLSYNLTAGTAPPEAG